MVTHNSGEEVTHPQSMTPPMYAADLGAVWMTACEFFNGCDFVQDKGNVAHHLQWEHVFCYAIDLPIS